MECVGRTWDRGVKSLRDGRSTLTCATGGLLSAPGPRCLMWDRYPDRRRSLGVVCSTSVPQPRSGRGSRRSNIGFELVSSFPVLTLDGSSRVFMTLWKQSWRGSARRWALRISEVGVAPRILPGLLSAWLYESAKISVRSKTPSGQSTAVIGQPSHGTSRRQPNLSACSRRPAAALEEKLQDEFAI